MSLKLFASLPLGLRMKQKTYSLFTRYRFLFVSDWGSAYTTPFSVRIGLASCLHKNALLCTAVVSLFAFSIHCSTANLVPRVSSLLYLYSGMQEAVRQSDWLFAILRGNSVLRWVLQFISEIRSITSHFILDEANSLWNENSFV